MMTTDRTPANPAGAGNAPSFATAPDHPPAGHTENDATAAARSTRHFANVWRTVRGVRGRVVTAAIVLLVAAFAVSVLTVRQMLELRVDDDIERELAQEVEELRALASGDQVTGVSFGDDVASLFSVFLRRNVPADDEAIYTFVAGRPHLSSFAAPDALVSDASTIERWTSLTQPTREDLLTGDAAARVLVAPVLSPDGEVLGTFVVSIFPASDLAAVSDLVRTFTLVALVVVLLTSLAAWGVIERVLRPVRDLTLATRSIGATDLGHRIAVQGDDELAELGHTFNEMLDRLDRSFRDQRSFLDDVAHELRTPITIVRGHLEVMGRHDDGARGDADGDDARHGTNERDDAIALITDELDRMSRYVDDLLTVARARRPDFLRRELVDVADIVDGVVQRGSSMATRDWVRAPGVRPGQILTEADPDRLLQAMLALATNAVQHTSDGDRITIGAAVSPATSPEVVLWVADTGPGIDPADQGRLFERFSRGPTSSVDRPDGTGLGLAITAAIASAHGGRVDVESRLGDGATFLIHIPLTVLDDHSERLS